MAWKFRFVPVACAVSVRCVASGPLPVLRKNAFWLPVRAPPSTVILLSCVRVYVVLPRSIV